MHTDLRYLLPVVEAEAPPPRHTADAVVAAARRRRVRRRASWASAATVLLIGAGMGVPQVTADPPAVPHLALPPADGYAYPIRELTGNIAPYTAGRLTVSGTVRVAPGYQQADVTESGQTVALLSVFRPGVFDASAYLDAEPLTIHGRPGKYRSSQERSEVVWEYQENAFALVASRPGLTPRSRDELVAVAATMLPGPETDVRLPFRLTYVPAGYSPSVVGDGRLELIKGTYPLTLRAPGIDPGRSTLRLSLLPRKQSKAAGRGDEACLNESCYRPAPDGKLVLEIFGTGFEPTGELRRILDNAEFDPAGYPASDVVGM